MPRGAASVRKDLLFFQRSSTFNSSTVLTEYICKRVIDEGRLTEVNNSFMRIGAILLAKCSASYGNPVAGVKVTAQQLGYFNLNAKTGTDGIADFGDVI